VSDTPRTDRYLAHGKRGDHGLMGNLSCILDYVLNRIEGK
jgi:hypothetical protein